MAPPTSSNAIMLTDGVWRRPNVAAYWMSQRILHMAFLAFFVMFLVVGVALTVLGFLDYGGQGGPMTRAFRILGVVALLLCIGFLIAACVVVSECITSSIKRGSSCSDDDNGEDMYGYRALYPTSCETIANSSSFNNADRNTIITNSGSDFIVPNTRIATDQDVSGDNNQTGAEGGIPAAPPLGLCPSCSCQLIARPVGFRAGVVPQSMSYPNGIVQFQKKRDTAIIQMKNNDFFNKQVLPNLVTSPAPPSFASDSSDSENEGRTSASPRDWV